MTTNTPTTAPDLDARVAVIMRAVKDWHYGRLLNGNLERIIRAELQKPVLHEPVTDAEIDTALREYRNSCIVPGIGMRAQFGQVLESFLQGRAKPAQANAAAVEPVAEVTCDGVMGVKFFDNCNWGCALPVGTKLYLHPPVPARAQEEITDAVTDAMVEAYLKEQRRTVEESDRLFGRPNVGGLKTGTVQEACRNGLMAAIRASKGEKT